MHLLLHTHTQTHSQSHNENNFLIQTLRIIINRLQAAAGGQPEVLTPSRFQRIQTPYDEQNQESLSSVTENQVASTLGFHGILLLTPGHHP